MNESSMCRVRRDQKLLVVNVQCYLPQYLVDEHAGEDADEDPDDGEAEHGAEAGVDGSVDDLAVGGGSEDVAKGGWKYCN